jgi:hypothetical protein
VSQPTNSAASGDPTQKAMSAAGSFQGRVSPQACQSAITQAWSTGA